jgi:hypothetical protein
VHATISEKRSASSERFTPNSGSLKWLSDKLWIKSLAQQLLFF